jgi:eukaryotic-like serine/threonine-protein kinase
VTAHEDIVQRARQRVGTVLSKKYRLDRLLGVGGMGTVYAASHEKNKNRVAIKMLHSELSVNADLRARFLREGYIANTVDHPSAVRVIDDDIAEDGAVFLVVELLDGETLESKTSRDGRMRPVEVARVGVGLLDVLAAAHAKGIVHRDIKPENVFLTKDGSVKVLDFGIARLHEPTSGAMTGHGQLMGTPAFMAPEQARGLEDVGPQADVWSAGATLLTLMSPRPLRDAQSAAAMLLLAATEPVPGATTFEPTIPDGLAAVIDRALAFAREDRWTTALDMKRALHVELDALRASERRVVLASGGRERESDPEGKDGVGPTEPPPRSEDDEALTEAAPEHDSLAMPLMRLQKTPHVVRDLVDFDPKLLADDTGPSSPVVVVGRNSSAMSLPVPAASSSSTMASAPGALTPAAVSARPQPPVSPIARVAFLLGAAVLVGAVIVTWIVVRAARPSPNESAAALPTPAISSTPAPSSPLSADLAPSSAPLVTSASAAPMHVLSARPLRVNMPPTPRVPASASAAAHVPPSPSPLPVRVDPLDRQ